MRKLFFSALACVAFAGSGFASNEVVENIILEEPLNIETGSANSFDEPVYRTFNCTVNVVVDDGKGGTITYTHQRTYYFVTYTQGTNMCVDYRNTMHAYYSLILSPNP